MTMLSGVFFPPRASCPTLRRPGRGRRPLAPRRRPQPRPLLLGQLPQQIGVRGGADAIHHPGMALRPGWRWR